MPTEGENVEVEELEDVETNETEADEVEEEAEESAAETEAEEDENEDGEEEEGGDDHNLGARAQKRIHKLLAERKEATAKCDALMKELEEAKKMSGDDGKAIMAAAEASGILPGLMTKDDAQSEKDILSYERVINAYETWLDDHDSGDEYELDGDKTMSYDKVVRRVGKLKDELREMKADYGPRRKELRSKVREIFELGTAALKAGWKPGTKSANKVRKVEIGPGKKSPKPKAEIGRGRDPEDIDVENGDDLEAFIVASNRRKKI